MIILDTNILSALMKATPDPTVIQWLNRFDPETVWTTSVTLFEVTYGLEMLPAGKKKKQLENAFRDMIRHDFKERIIDFDREAAQTAGVIAALQKRSGKMADFRDLQIAGIAISKKAFLATRNEKHFQHAGLKILNPWKY